MRDRKSHQKRAQVSDQIRGAVGIDTDDAIRHRRYLRHTMRAASSAEQDIKGVSDKGDIGCAAFEIASNRTRLTGWEIVDCFRDNAVGIDLGDTRASDATSVRPNGRHDLFAAAFSRVRPANSPFGNIKVAVRPKLQAARIV